MTSKIEWTGESWNPLRARRKDGTGQPGWHCEHASPGCQHCYSETRNKSGRCNMGTKLPFKPGHREDVEIYLDEAQLVKPLRLKKPRTIFVCSMTDLFGSFHTDEMLDRIFAVMALCPQHTFQVLTKRSDRMREYMTSNLAVRVQNAVDNLEPDGLWKFKEHEPWVISDISDSDTGDHLPNVWLGVSVEDQRRADERIPDLLATPAAVRWLSCEPLLGPVDLTMLHHDGITNIDALRGAHGVVGMKGDCPSIDWVVCGGESGAQARPMHPDWARNLRDQCAAAGVPFFFKQWGEWLVENQMGHIDLTERNVSSYAKTYLDEGTAGPFHKVGKKRAGRLLDGVQHDAFPGRVS